MEKVSCAGNCLQPMPFTLNNQCMSVSCGLRPKNLQNEQKKKKKKNAQSHFDASSHETSKLAFLLSNTREKMLYQ